MDTHYRFNRDEISKILKCAAELEHRDDVQDDSDGLTVDELRQVSKEVGINPKYIAQAVEQLQNPKQSITTNLMGGPFSYQYAGSVNGRLDPDEWEDIVTEIRRIHGGIGKTGNLGNTFEWEQRKKEVGYIQISLSPKKKHTRISINADYSYYATVIYSATAALGFALISILFSILEKKAGLPILSSIIGGGLSMAVLLGGARFYLSNWMKRKRETYHKLTSRFQELLGTDIKQQAESSMIIDKQADKQAIESEKTKRSRINPS